MNRDRAMIIDSEQSNLDLIAQCLSAEPLVLDLQTESLAAWNRLSTSNKHYSLVVVDSLMPALDGLAFLQRMKADPRFAEIPVIMQTSEASPDKVKEGLQAGAYYYLSKPFQPETLISIVRSAVEDHRSLRVVSHLSKHQEAAQKLLLSAEYRFSTLRDINDLVPVLSGYTPKPHLTAAGLADLLLNAIEHGNLGISYAEKSRLKFEGRWDTEIERRQALLEYRKRFAVVRIEQKPDRILYTITDQGDGFDWQPYLELDPARAFDPNGRGIAIALKMSFSSLEFLGKGNQVVATVTL